MNKKAAGIFAAFAIVVFLYNGVGDQPDPNDRNYAVAQQSSNQDSIGNSPSEVVQHLSKSLPAYTVMVDKRKKVYLLTPKKSGLAAGIAQIKYNSQLADTWNEMVSALVGMSVYIDMATPGYSIAIVNPDNPNEIFLETKDGAVIRNAAW